MNLPTPVFFDHSRHKLQVEDLDAHLDVLAFSGEEHLSQPFSYSIEFTCAEQDLAAEQLLGRHASFSLHAVPVKLPVMSWEPPPPIKPLRILHGVITSLQRLSASRDEARYQVTLQPRLALLERGQQYRIYQHKSVPEIVEHVLRSRHNFEYQDFVFNLNRQYPRREQVMQYGESDLAFISRLLAEVGIWYRFTSHERLRIDVVNFCDGQRGYQFDVELPHRPPAGLSSGEDGVWALQTRHQVVEKHVNIRTYHHRDAQAYLDAEVDQTRGAKTTYGEAYHYAEPYRVLGGRYDHHEDLQCESGYFYARLRHDRYLNQQTQLNGLSNSATLAPGHVVTITDGAPQAFTPRCTIIGMTTRAARDASFECRFEAMPYSETLCFRPRVPAKPLIPGTVPARVTSAQAHDQYAEIDKEGRYKVNFLFDRDTWELGEESLWLRLARPYAGDTYGLHLPLICGTEVAIAFEQGDPDRPYIAHALHDSEHPDHVTLRKRDYTRNVLRTPANNKLRMEDERGQEHVKLSTDYGGKSQLNLGHLVDAEKKKRGEGFELRTDDWGAIRGGKGVFISADAQAKAQGQQLDMNAAVGRLQQAGEQLQKLSVDAQAASADPADVAAQLQLLRQELDQLKASVLLLSAPQGIALTSGNHLQLAAQNNLMLNAGAEADISVVKRLFIGVGQGLSLFVRKLGLKLIANQGPVQIQAQNDKLELFARHGLDITSTEDEVRITAKKKITLNGGGSYITLEARGIEAGSAGDYNVKAADYLYTPIKTTLATPIVGMPKVIDPPLEFHEQFRIVKSDGEQPWASVPYKVTAASGQVWKGTTDSQGFTERVYTAKPEELSLVYDIEEEEEEEELEGITLRLGLFFDGTGNNQANAAATEQCRREDLALFDESEMESMVSYCKKYGFDGFDGDGFSSAPDNSYGNAPSNVVHLFRLYPDHATNRLPPAADIGYVKVYLEGIGTYSNGEDSLIGMASGLGETGVVARVKQAPQQTEEQWDLFQKTNPGVYIRQIEFDIFGFSRGAAAARHCANELFKPGRGLFNELLQAGRFTLVTTFDPAVDVSINFIGLFDTVAAIGGIDSTGFNNVADDHNPGVNLYLPPGCARQVIQLQARDECRHNFSLNGVHHHHRQICLPGVHSDIGGGYLPRAREKVLLTKPIVVDLKPNQPMTSLGEWSRYRTKLEALRASGIADDGEVEIRTWETVKAPRGGPEPLEEQHLMAIELDRPVRGELALIALRVMRELGVGHGVPFMDVEARPDLALPEDLKPIAARILDQVLGGNEVNLDPEQERLLLRRYIHQSAHWVPSAKLVLVSKPAKDNERNVYPNRPQKGYPQ
ncbi:type VI secretion system tip protein VgrG [Pseudomonas putida]|uniref:type VI secretion system tip protein VgrG n=1 Tax=Pseudomonas putida TaxID=303 RepID=UPI003D975ECC